MGWSVLALAAVVAVGFFFLRPVALGGPASYVVVTGTSMEPTYHEGDLVVAQSRGSYEVGDIVVFPADDHFASGELIIHRIIDVRAGVYVPQGDNRPEADTYRPTDETILGEAVIHVPVAGRAFTWLGRPAVAATLLGALVLTSRSTVTRSRRRRAQRRRTHNVHDQTARPQTSTLPRPLWALAGLALAVIGLVGFGAVGLLAPGPAEEASTDTGAYQHRTTYAYEGRVAPSALHPDGRVQGPEATDAAEGEGAEWGTPVQVEALRELTLRADYDLQVDGEPATVDGTAGATALIESMEGWSTTVQLAEEVEWTGGQAQLELSLGGSALLDRIAQITAEMGSGGPYDITIESSFHAVGSVGGQMVDEVHQSSFSMRLDGSVLLLQTNATEVESRRLDGAGAVQPGDGRVAVPGGDWGLVGLGLLLVVAAGSGGARLVGGGRDEAGRIESRYRSLLVDVDEVEHAPGCHLVQMQSIAGLVRIAKACDGVILHQALGDGHRYSVVDIDTVYAFTLGDAEPFSTHLLPPDRRGSRPTWNASPDADVPTGDQGRLLASDAR